MTWLKAVRAAAAHARRMHQTYELYRDLLEADRAIASVEVRLVGEPLFTLER